MQLGFVTAIFPDLTLEQVLQFAADEGFDCVELMCWPPGKAERRYAGVTHLDVASLDDAAVQSFQDLLQRYGVGVSALGYYPNPLDPDADRRRAAIDHLGKVIAAARRVGVSTVTTFVGRDPAKTIDDNWPLFSEVWPAIVAQAEAAGVRLAIENCPMLFSEDEWPGGKNLAYCPSAWRRMFRDVPSPAWGLNFDPSHLLWLGIDCERAIRDFADRIYHAHAKDTRIDREALYEVGVCGLGWQHPKIPGLGDVDWSGFFAALTDAGYNGPVCIEIEDRAYEGSLDDRKRSLRQSKRFLEQFVSG